MLAIDNKWPLSLQLGWSSKQWSLVLAGSRGLRTASLLQHPEAVRSFHVFPMCFTSINYPLLCFALYDQHSMGRVVSDLGWVSYGYEVWSFSKCSESETSQLCKQGLGVIVFSQQHDKIPLPMPTRWLAAPLSHAPLCFFLFKDRGHLLCQTPMGVMLLVRLDCWSQGNAGTDSVVSLCPYKLLLTL